MKQVKQQNYFITPHAGREMKKDAISKQTAHNIAQNGIVVRTWTIGNRTRVMKRGMQGRMPVHVVTEKKKIITVTKADGFQFSASLVNLKPSCLY